MMIDLSRQNYLSLRSRLGSSVQFVSYSKNKKSKLELRAIQTDAFTAQSFFEAYGLLVPKKITVMHPDAPVFFTYNKGNVK